VSLRTRQARTRGRWARRSDPCCGQGGRRSHPPVSRELYIRLGSGWKACPCVTWDPFLRFSVRFSVPDANLVPSRVGTRALASCQEFNGEVKDLDGETISGGLRTRQQGGRSAARQRRRKRLPDKRKTRREAGARH